MIDKQDYYHGATLLKAIEDKRFSNIECKDGAYLINEKNLVFFKYTTKTKSPWNFKFNNNEVENIINSFSEDINIIYVFICDGDGFCSLKVQELLKLLDNKSGWISIRRRFNEQYLVAGQIGHLNNKVSRNRWPQILYESVEDISLRRD